MTRDLARGSRGVKDGPDLGIGRMPTTTTTQVPFRTVNRVGIRYADGGGSQKPTVVLTSPAGERVRVRADLGLAVRARSPLTGSQAYPR